MESDRAPLVQRTQQKLGGPSAGQPRDDPQVRPHHTTIRTGLRVRARLLQRRYKKGIKIIDAQMQGLTITKDDALPKWNYTIRPN